MERELGFARTIKYALGGGVKLLGGEEYERSVGEEGDKQTRSQEGADIQELG